MENPKKSGFAISKHIESEGSDRNCPSELLGRNHKEVRKLV